MVDMKVGDYVIVIGNERYCAWKEEIFKVSDIRGFGLFPILCKNVKNKASEIFGEDELRVLTDEEIKNLWVYDI